MQLINISKKPYALRKCQDVIYDSFRYDVIWFSSEPKAQKAPRPPRQPDVRDYQFFPPNLFELLDREVQVFRKQVNYKVPIDSTHDNPKKSQKEAQQRIDDAVELNEQEMRES